MPGLIFAFMLSSFLPYLSKNILSEFAHHSYLYYSVGNKIYCTFADCGPTDTPYFKRHSVELMARKRKSLNGNGKSSPNNKGTRRGRRSRRNRLRGDLQSNNFTVSRRVAPLSIGSVVSPNSIAKLRRLPIVHSELINSVNCTSLAFSGTNNPSMPINPGLASVFPWLSRLGITFEKYLVRSMRFHYIPSIPTSTAGTMYFVVDYDSFEDPPSSKTQFMMNADAMSSTVWAPCTLTLDPQKLAQRGELYIRAGSLPANQDVKTYDLGKLFIGSGGAASSLFVGDLYCEYVIDLLIPTAWEDNILSGFWSAGSTTSETIAHPLGTVVVADSNSPASPCILVYDSLSGNNRLVWSVSGQFLVTLTMSGTGFAGDVYLDCTPAFTVAQYGQDSYAQFNYSGSTSATAMTVVSGVSVTDGQETRLAIAGAGAALTTVDAYELLVLPLNQTVYANGLF